MPAHCPKHRTYQAKRKPTADCDPCRQQWAESEHNPANTSLAADLRAAKAAPAAAKLIAAAKARQFTAAPPEAALAGLREVLAYNDTVPLRARVSADDAIAMLAEHGWTCRSRQGLDSLCRRVLGRKTYGTK